jgi:hypothetical protein
LRAPERRSAASLHRAAPREEAWHDACEACERPVHLHEGPHAARALTSPWPGGSPRRFWRWRPGRPTARRRWWRASGRGACALTPRPVSRAYTRHGQLVADWVEVFTPIVFEPHRPSAWPTAGSLLLDDLPFSVWDPATGGFWIAFRVFCAAGFERRRPKLWRVEAFRDAS